jgi:hypothetical protein
MGGQGAQRHAMGLLDHPAEHAPQQPADATSDAQSASAIH